MQIIDQTTQAELQGITFRPLEITLKETFDYFRGMSYCDVGEGQSVALKKVRPCMRMVPRMRSGGLIRCIPPVPTRPSQGPSYTTSLNCLR